MITFVESQTTRLDRALAYRLGVGRRQAVRLIEAGLVRCDGRVQRRPGFMLNPGTAVAVEGLLPGEGVLAPVAQPDLPLDVLFEDALFVAVQKPPAVATHPLRAGELGTLASALAARYPECSSASDDPREGGFVHRLDIGTSGVLLAARTREAWRALRASFDGGAVQKRYLAVVRRPAGWPSRGSISAPIVTPRRGGAAVRVVLNDDARSSDALSGDPVSSAGLAASTDYELLEAAGELGLVSVRCRTGRLHQVRAHLAATGAPLLGDPIYGSEREAGEPLGFFLHASELTLPHPSDGRALTLRAPLPPMQRARLSGWRFTSPD